MPPPKRRANPAVLPSKPEQKPEPPTFRGTHLNLIFHITGQKNTVPIPRIFILMFEDLEVAAFLNQCMYWQGKCHRRDGYWWHSNREWHNELALSRRAVDKCREKLNGYGIVTCRKGMAMGKPTWFYRVDGNLLDEWFIEYQTKHSFITAEEEEEDPFPENAGTVFDEDPGPENTQEPDGLM